MAECALFFNIMPFQRIVMPKNGILLLCLFMLNVFPSYIGCLESWNPKNSAEYVILDHIICRVNSALLLNFTLLREIQTLQIFSFCNCHQDMSNCIKVQQVMSL